MLVAAWTRQRANSSDRAINLTKNSQFFVRKGDVERLLQAGFLMRLS